MSRSHLRYFLYRMKPESRLGNAGLQEHVVLRHHTPLKRGHPAGNPAPLFLRVLADVTVPPRPPSSLHSYSPGPASGPTSGLCPQLFFPPDSLPLADLVTQSHLLGSIQIWPCPEIPALPYLHFHWEGRWTHSPSPLARHTQPFTCSIAPGATEEMHAGPLSTLHIPHSCAPLCITHET